MTKSGHALVGKDTGRTYRLMDRVIVRLVEADALRGSTVFEVMSGEIGEALERQSGHARGGRSRDGRRSDGARGRCGQGQRKTARTWPPA
jgi:ribonuclease R